MIPDVMLVTELSGRSISEISWPANYPMLKLSVYCRFSGEEFDSLRDSGRCSRGNSSRSTRTAASLSSVTNHQVRMATCTASYVCSTYQRWPDFTSRTPCINGSTACAALRSANSWRVLPDISFLWCDSIFWQSGVLGTRFRKSNEPKCLESCLNQFPKPKSIYILGNYCRPHLHQRLARRSSLWH